ncbi:hypothetical protein [Streptomyces clavifer]|uniref:hypothetical protein n=1 Tax=Streptomyces clavifer TaxID=68188 RepID=UPI00365003EE
MTAQDHQPRSAAPVDDITPEERAALDALQITDADVTEAMTPVAEQIRTMAEDTGTDLEEFFLSLDEELFGALCVGYLTAKRAGHTGAELERKAERLTLAALARTGRADLGPLAQVLGRSR